jgi:hypothetical protein
MSNFTFAFFEGAHDANFVARVLCESGRYQTAALKVDDFAEPVGAFLKELYHQSSVEHITVGQYVQSLAPQIALSSSDGNSFILGFVTGGCTQTAGAKEILTGIMAFAQRDELGALTSRGHRFAILFFYDADSHGREETQANFEKAYAEVFGAYAGAKLPSHASWGDVAGVPLGLYIFCDGTGVGTLEDCVKEALSQHAGLLTATDAYLRANNFDLPFEVNGNADPVAARAKTYKAAFTVLGQRERDLAGSSLAVTLRKSKLLDNVFDFDGTGVAAQLLKIAELPPI